MWCVARVTCLVMIMIGRLSGMHLSLLQLRLSQLFFFFTNFTSVCSWSGADPEGGSKGSGPPPFFYNTNP